MTFALSARTKANPMAVLAIVLTSYLMIILDTSVVITGLPQIRDSLGFSTVELSWVQNAYMLFFGGFLLLAARAGDVFGRKRMFRLGLLLFTGSSLVIGLALNSAMLIGAPWVEDGKLYNAVALLDGGRIAGLRFKANLPNYGVFDEKRVF